VEAGAAGGTTPPRVGSSGRSSRSRPPRIAVGDGLGGRHPSPPGPWSTRRRRRCRLPAAVNRIRRNPTTIRPATPSNSICSGLRPAGSFSMNRRVDPDAADSSQVAVPPSVRSALDRATFPGRSTVKSIDVTAGSRSGATRLGGIWPITASSPTGSTVPDMRQESSDPWVMLNSEKARTCRPSRSEFTSALASWFTSSNGTRTRKPLASAVARPDTSTPSMLVVERSTSCWRSSAETPASSSTALAKYTSRSIEPVRSSFTCAVTSVRRQDVATSATNPTTTTIAPVSRRLRIEPVCNSDQLRDRAPSCDRARRCTAVVRRRRQATVRTAGAVALSSRCGRRAASSGSRPDGGW